VKKRGRIISDIVNIGLVNNGAIIASFIFLLIITQSIVHVSASGL